MHSKKDFTSDSRAADFGTASGRGQLQQLERRRLPDPSWGPATFYEESTTKQEALYGMARFSVTDPLKVIVGARVTNFEQTGHGQWTAAYTVKNDSEITPYAGIVYDLSENYSAYASYTSIFLPQNLKDYGGKILDPIEGKAKEVGIKGEFLDGRVNASLAVFDIRQDNLGQSPGTVDRDGDTGPPLPEAYYVGTKGATSRGFEFELNGELARGWNATAGYSRFRAKDSRCRLQQRLPARPVPRVHHLRAGRTE
jgi:outer membrane receptor for ferric coprogen and ferric-rhodotorulic acid